jgi:hypothetical protein
MNGWIAKCFYSSEIHAYGQNYFSNKNLRDCFPPFPA